MDDERSLTELYETWLCGPYDTDVANSGTAAQRMLETDRYEVVLLDRWMPDVPGDDVLASIRARELDCRVAMLTGVCPDFDIIDKEFDSYVLKPVSQAELLEVVERLYALPTYRPTLQELYTLLEKRSVLVAEKTVAELHANDEFARLQDEITTRRSQVQACIESISDEAFRAIFEA